MIVLAEIRTQLNRGRELLPAHFGTSPDIYTPTLLYGKRHRWYPKTVRERRVVIHLELLDWVGCL